jgi:hypothetical protein
LPASHRQHTWQWFGNALVVEHRYFHVVFTVPHELNVLALENPRLFYDLLFTTSAQTLLETSRKIVEQHRRESQERSWSSQIVP